MSVKIIEEIRCDICNAKIVAPMCRVVLTMSDKRQTEFGGLLYTKLIHGDTEIDVCKECAIKMYNGQTVLHKEIITNETH